MLNYEPQGASGPGRWTACIDAKNTKRLDDSVAKRFDDPGKALNSTLSEKTKGRGGG